MTNVQSKFPVIFLNCFASLWNSGRCPELQNTGPFNFFFQKKCVIWISYENLFVSPPTSCAKSVEVFSLSAVIPRPPICSSCPNNHSVNRHILHRPTNKTHNSHKSPEDSVRIIVRAVTDLENGSIEVTLSKFFLFSESFGGELTK